MGARGLAALAATVLLAGCADLVTPVDAPTSPEPTYVRITISTAAVHGPVYLQGVIRFVRITGEGATIERELEVDGDTRVRLPAGGEYELASWARPCAKTCNTLGRPIGRCSTVFTATAGRITLVEMQSPMRGDCSLTVGG